MIRNRSSRKAAGSSALASPVSTLPPPTASRAIRPRPSLGSSTSKTSTAPTPSTSSSGSPTGQRPHEKINHALVLGGAQGIGKDTLLEPVKYAVGPWNFWKSHPQQMLGRFNGFLKTVILRVSEARDLGDIDRFQFYDHMKAYTAAPPDVLRVDEKHLREHNVFNVCGVVITTNHKTDGIYLPADDRRHFVAWSELDQGRLRRRLLEHALGLVRQRRRSPRRRVSGELDLSALTPKRRRRRPRHSGTSSTPTARRRKPNSPMCSTGSATPMHNHRHHRPQRRAATSEWIRDRKNRRVIPHRLEKCGYIASAQRCRQGRIWKIHGKRQAIYTKSVLSVRDRLKAAARLTNL